jgi:dihydrofolate reductase
MKNIKLYFTRSANGIIGRENESIWYLHNELINFREKTKGQIVLMGNRAWEVIPTNMKPFTHCSTIIASKDRSFTYFGININVIYDLEWYIKNYCSNEFEQRELWIIGGGDILNQSIKYADTIEVIEVSGVIDGDVHAPKIDGRSFKLINSGELITDNFSNITYYRSIYTRISKSCVQKIDQVREMD